MYVPVSGARTSSGYGMRFHPIKRVTRLHGGIDFAAPTGSAIRAVVPGVVISASYAGDWGNLVKIRHQDGTTGLYAHMSRMQARPGMRVSRGTVIGRVGSTGSSTGPHLHFGVYRSGRPVNPMPWLSKDYRQDQSGSSPLASQPGTYGGQRLSAEQLRNARTIISVGRSMGASQRDLTIALMTSYQESRLQNLNYGDRDSVGLFQQRAGWGSRAQRMNPTSSARMFFSGGVRGPGTPGLLDLGRRARLSLTGAAQAVQRSAFPNAYAQWEGLAKSILGGSATLDPGMEGLMVEEEPMLTIPTGPAGSIPTESVFLPGVSRPMEGSVNPEAELDASQIEDIRDQGPFNRSTNEPDIKRLLYDAEDEEPFSRSTNEPARGPFNLRELLYG